MTKYKVDICNTWKKYYLLYTRTVPLRSGHFGFSQGQRELRVNPQLFVVDISN